MKYKNMLISVLVCLLVCMSLVVGCGESDPKTGFVDKPESKSESESENNVVTVTDSAGRSVELPQPLERAVVLYTGMAEAVNIVKAQDKVIGVDESIQTHPYLGMQEKESVGQSTQPSYEKIVELRPQVVVAPANVGPIPVQEIIEKLEPVGIKVVLLDIHKPETSNEALMVLAEIFGKENNAVAFLDWKAAQIEILGRAAALKPEERVRVFTTTTTNFEQEKWSTSGAGLAAHQTIELAGGVNVAQELEGSVSVSAEWILEQNPHALILNDRVDDIVGFTLDDFESAEIFKERVKANKVLGNTEAAQRDRICIIDNSIFSGDKSYLGALYLAKWFYPDQFKDLDPEKELKEYFETWLGVPFQGKWVYTPAAK